MSERLGERLRDRLFAGRSGVGDASAGFASASESGTIRSTQAPNTSSVCCQPKRSISATASGENRNCPNEPAAVPAPNANVRQVGGISLPKAPMTTVKDEPASPNPITTPAVRWSMPGVLA